jgi:hypothetical protein
MKSTIKVVTENYGGFGVHNWVLVVTKDKLSKEFFLGQDAKFCSRVLGMSPKYIVEQIGDNDLGNEETLNKLGEFIVEQLELTEENIFNLESWELCSQ